MRRGSTLLTSFMGWLIYAMTLDAMADPARRPLWSLHGEATYYGRAFQGRPTASGEPFDRHELVAAHRSLPFGTIVRVVNLENGRSVQVRIVDRGPYGKNYREGAIIDVSTAAARKLRMIRDGQVRVRVDVLRLES
jgi:rare lipoprotein A